MEMTGTQSLPVSQQVAWDALNDPEMLKASIMGCDLLDRTSDTEFNAGVTAAIATAEGFELVNSFTVDDNVYLVLRSVGERRSAD